MKKNIIILIIFLIVLLILIFFALYKHMKATPTQNTSSTTTAQVVTNSQQTSPQSIVPAPAAETLALPIAQFKERVTKKPFGIYITPQNSPVQPERFSGYHTGADAEYQDVSGDVPVYAIADGTIVLSETASGYGGVFMMSIDLNGAKHTILYGHIRSSSLPKVGQIVSKGEQLAVLGTGNSAETDGERRHLHFAVLSDDRIDIKGYVQNQSELSGWIDPLILIREF